MVKWIEDLHSRMDSLGDKLKDKEISIPVDLTAGILFFAIAAVIMLIMPSQVAISDNDVVNGRAFPSLLMWVMMLCSGILIVKEVYKLITRQPLERKAINLLTELKALVIFGILLITFLLSKLTGQFIVGALFCSLSFLFYFRCKKPLYYGITLTLTVLIWAAFKFVLNVNF